MIKARVAELLDKEMDRKSFLTHIIAALVALVGVSTAINALSLAGSSSSKNTKQERGYGGSPYGR